MSTSYKTAARNALANRDRAGFLAIRAGEAHAQALIARDLPKTVRLAGPGKPSSFGPIYPTADNAGRKAAIAAACARNNRLHRMARRARGELAYIVERCDGFYHVEARVLGFPALDISGKLASRSAAEDFAHRSGYLIGEVA